MGTIKGKPAFPAGSSTPVTSKPAPVEYKPSAKATPGVDQSKPEPVPAATQGPNKDVPPRKARPGSI